MPYDPHIQQFGRKGRGLSYHVGATSDSLYCAECIMLLAITDRSKDSKGGLETMRTRTKD